MDQLREELNVSGYVVIDDFLRPEECDELSAAAYDLAEKLLQEDNAIKKIFDTKDEPQLKDKYFLESNDKIRAFVEEKAFNEKGEFNELPKFSVNKIGHALHYLHPTFRQFTYTQQLKTSCDFLRLKEPAVVQSMVVFKNPRIGGEVQPHQDGTYLFSSPVPAYGFWIALQDTTVDNGCLWIAPGSHKSGIHRRLMRKRTEDGSTTLTYDNPCPVYSSSSFRPVPVKKGSCIVLHGNVVHKSEENKSANPRPAYTFHLVDMKDNEYSAENWLQMGPEAPFENIYSVTDDE